MNAPDPAARERVLTRRAAPFYEHGFHAVGVDLIVAQAAVAKTTLYRHFLQGRADRRLPRWAN